MGNESEKEKKKDNKVKETKKENEKEIKKDTKVDNEVKKKSEIDIKKYIKDCSQELSESNSYLAKKIEDEYFKIESDIQQLCLGKCSDDEEKENESLGKYLFKLKNIAEKALELAEKLKDSLFEEFKEKNKVYSNLKNHDDPGCIVEFSSWSKNSLIDEKQFIKEFCEKYKDKDYTEEDYNIFIKLTGIYLQCFLSSQKIEFKKCKNFSEFDSKEMYDLAEIRDNKKNKKKVNFCVLPGLFTNELYFNSGKMHVFTYLPNTYHMNIK